MKDFLQGVWLKHPLHPLLVHIPTALWPAALLFDVLSRFGVGGNAMVQTSFYCIAFGLLVALAAVPTGLADWWDIKPGKPARRLGIYHMSINLTVAVLELINLLLRWGTFATDTQVDTVPLVLSIVSVLLLSVSGYLGGRMVYDQGISIARLSKGEWRKRAEAGGAAVPEQKGAEG
jgi:uncharacterized membrane protein